MRVRTLKTHYNGHGPSYAKSIGDEYDHPSPELLITRGKVEPATPAAKKAPARRRRRARK